MTIDSKLVEGVHSRRWERMNNLLAASTAAAFSLTDSKEQTGRVLLITSTTTPYLYDCKKGKLQFIFNKKSF